MPRFNEQKYEDLVLSLVTGTCIFYGAGVSKLAGYKLWNELRGEMITFFWENRSQIPENKRKKVDLSRCDYLRKHGDLIEAFGYLYYIDETLFINGIREIFYSDERRSNNKIFSLLNILNNGKNYFVTTNIDIGFQKFIGLSDEYISINPSFSNPPKLINYLHGRIDKVNSWIFTRGQYNEGYVINDKPCLNFLINVFENYNVLFIGYGLEEFDIKNAISMTRKRKEHFWLEASSRGNEDYLQVRRTDLEQNYNIKLIPYYIDEDGHEILINVIKSLSDVMNNKLRGVS